MGDRLVNRLAKRQAAKPRLPQPKRYDSLASRKRLLKASLDIFSRVGYDAATTRAIAKRAKVNESLIQRYFGGKNGLLIALIQQFSESVTNSQACEFKGSLEEEITAYFNMKIDHTRTHRKFLKIVLSRAIVDPAVRDEVARFARSQAPAMLKRIEALEKNRLIKDGLDLALVSRILGLFGASLGLMSEIVESLEPEVVEHLVPLAARILAAGLSSGKP